MAGLDVATTVRPAGAGRYDVELDPAWQVAGRPNGSYLLAVTGRAALTELAATEDGRTFPHPLVASAHFVSSPEPGPATVDVEVLRRGNRTAQTRVSLSTAAGRAVEALVTCGTLETALPHYDGVPAPELPPEADCPRLPVQGPGFEVPLMAVISERMDPATMGWAGGKASGAGELRGWVRFDDGREPDPLALLAVVDALPPATFDLGLTGWVPTLELTAHVRAVPATGPLVVRQRARHIAGGRVDEECDVWDSTGRLVATGHQLAGVRHP
jgi:acyl-coenzyme A thioesterase PaaI-like protein